MDVNRAWNRRRVVAVAAFLRDGPSMKWNLKTVSGVIRTSGWGGGRAAPYMCNIIPL